MSDTYKNVKYESTWFVNTYSTERNIWDEFYESERTIMGRVFKSQKPSFSILDAGCACGGLLSAIQDRFSVGYYKGIDIVESQIEYAKDREDFKVEHDFVCQDVSAMSDVEKYDVVVSLSCVDFNYDVRGMLDSCWRHVAEGGYLIASFRLTDKKSLMKEAYQMVETGDGSPTEKWNYVVFNFHDLMDTLLGLRPMPINIDAYGYWGRPNATAVVPYDRLCFSVFAVKKTIDSPDYKDLSDTAMHLELPAGILKRSEKKT